ncbi:MAG: peptidylprolyl isomerase, partial [Sutterellaceae bacterium]|nr:peptidylprolyl isomerase [Sutterellaceae bacterium]
ERIMNDRSLSGEIAKEHVEVSEQAAIEMIKTFPAFQKDGKFEPELYQNYLASAGYSDEYFVYLMRGDLSRQLLASGITRTTIVPTVIAEGLHNLLTERREIALHRIATTDFVKDVKITDEQAKEYWTNNQKAFERPDQIDVQYVVLTPDLFKNVQPSEEDIKTFYDQNATRFRSSEERRASHILIDLADGKEKALAKANEILAKVKANPADFAKLAKENSADTGSAQEGGDLGYFGTGMMVPAFETAVFKAKKGDIVGPIETEFGYHIIEVTGIRGEAQKSLADVRDEIIRMYQEQESQKRFAEEADNFTNMVYEQSDSLDPVIEKYKLKAETVKNVSHQGPADAEIKRLLNQHVMDNLFSDECLREKRNAQAIEVAPNTLVAARVVEFHPKHVAAFEEVRANILQMMTTQEAAAKAKAQGTDLIAKVRQDKNAVKFEDAITVSRSNPHGQGFNLVNAVMRVPAEELPAYVGVAADDGFYIAHVIKSEKQEAKPEAIEANRNEVAQMFGQADQAMYLKALREKHEAVVLNKDYMPGAVDVKDAEN